MPSHQVVSYAGLEVTFDPVDERNFYYTKEKPKFLLRLKNISDQRVNMKLAWFVQTAVGRTGHGIIVDLEPETETAEPIGDRLLAIPGWGLVGILTVDPPLPPERPEEIPLDYPGFHTLYTFLIFDEDVHRIEEKRHKKIRGLSLAMVILAGIAAVAGVVSLLGMVVGWW